MSALCHVLTQIAVVAGLCAELVSTLPRDLILYTEISIFGEEKRGRESVCYERDHRSRDGKRCFTNDEGGSLEVGVQAQTSNHRKRRGLRVFIVNVSGKGVAVLHQVRIKKTNASEPLMTCRTTSSAL